MPEQPPSQPQPAEELTQPAGGIYERQDPAYAQWLAENPRGFVFLTRTNFMHRAGCRSVQPLRRRERWPVFMVGGAWVARAVARLDHDLATIGEDADRCTRCNPGFDMKGVAMLAEYLRRIRGLPPSE